MADSQMSQSGPLFPKIGQFEAICFDFAPTGRFWWRGGPQAAVLDFVQDAGVRDENFNRACTLFCRSKARLAPAKIRQVLAGKVCWKSVMLEKCDTFPRKSPKRMHRRCSIHYVCKLWHRHIGLGDCLDKTFRLGNFPRNIVTTRLSVSCHRWENQAFK